MSGTNRQVAPTGVLTAAISSSMVGLLHRYTGRGPTRARTTISAVQELSGRRVVAFMSNNHIDPDLAVEVFILEPVADDGPWMPPGRRA